MKDKNFKKENSCQEGKKRYSKDNVFQNDLSINGYSNFVKQELNNMDLQDLSNEIPTSKDFIDYPNFWDNEIKNNNKNYCVKKHDKLNEHNDYYENNIYKTNQPSENNKSNVYNELLNIDCKEYTENIVKDSFKVSLSLKDKLFEDFLAQKENIKKGKYIPKFINFQNLPKYEGLTKKYFNHVRNEWFREIMHKDNFIEYRNEVMSKRFFQNYKVLLN